MKKDNLMALVIIVASVILIKRLDTKDRNKDK